MQAGRMQRGLGTLIMSPVPGWDVGTVHNEKELGPMSAIRAARAPNETKASILVLANLIYQLDANCWLLVSVLHILPHLESNLCAVRR